MQLLEITYPFPIVNSVAVVILRMDNIILSSNLKVVSSPRLYYIQFIIHACIKINPYYVTKVNPVARYLTSELHTFPRLIHSSLWAPETSSTHTDL